MFFTGGIGFILMPPASFFCWSGHEGNIPFHSCSQNAIVSKTPLFAYNRIFLSVSIFPQNSGKPPPLKHHFGFLTRIWRNHSRAENSKRCLNERISARGTIKNICALSATRHAISALVPLILPYISISVMPPLHSHAAMIAMSRRCDYIVVAVRWLCHHAAIELPWQCDYVVIIAQRNCNDSMTA